MEQAVLQKWDYHVEEFSNTDKMNDTLARLGNEGWELVSVTGGNQADTGAVKTLRRKHDAYCAFFKRPSF
jgi:hypothetical protein